MTRDEGTAPARVVVIGGGFAGAALALHLLSADRPGSITIVERRPTVGRGVAYDTTDPVHRLNVPAGRMSVDPEDPDAFVRYAAARGVDATPTSLLSRALYGDYVEDALQRASRARPGVVRIVRGSAVAVRGPAGAREVLLDGGAALPADVVVLAVGSGPPVVPPAVAPIADDPRVVRDPWSLGPIDRDARVLVVGTGLTAIDVLLGLQARGHAGRTLALSRTGQWPGAHLDEVVWTGRPVMVDGAPMATADELWDRIRRTIARAEADGVPWQAAVDAIRPTVPAAWAGLSETERAAFLARHLRTWEHLRHRAPAASLRALRDLREAIVLVDRAAEIREARAFRAGLVVRIELTGADVAFRAGRREEWPFERIVLCTGASTDWGRSANPVVRDLVARGEVAVDPTRLGAVTDDAGRAIGADGRAREDLWLLGAARRPAAWEATAVPDLALQAVALAASLHRALEPLAARARAAR